MISFFDEGTKDDGHKLGLKGANLCEMSKYVEYILFSLTKLGWLLSPPDSLSLLTHQESMMAIFMINLKKIAERL